MNVSGGISNAIANFNETPATGFLANSNTPLPPTRFRSLFTNGVLSDQIDGFSGQRLSFTGSTPQTIALNTLTDFLGITLTTARICFIAFKNLSQVDNDVFQIGNAAANQFLGICSTGATVPIYPSSTSALNDGFTIISAPGTTAMPVGGSTYNLKIDPGALAKILILLIGTRST